MLLSGAKTNFEFQHIRVDEVIWQLVENMVLYHQAKVEVDIQVDDQAVLTLEGNDKLLELAIGNLLENAIKYSDNQPVKILFTEANGQLELSIIDQGIGISQHDLRYIRQNFYRGNNTHTYQGKGIGLSIANIIFTLHKIDMQIVPQQHGTTVVLLF